MVFSVLLTLTLGINSSTIAQIQEVTVKVNGLSCPFCVKGVEKHLKKVKGVSQLTTSLKKGEVRLKFKAGAPFDLVSLQKAVVKGGFTPGKVKLKATGLVRKENDNFVFRDGDSKNIFSLHDPHPKKKKAHLTLETSTVKRLEKVVQSKARVQLSGEVHAHKDALQGLSVDKLKVIENEK